MEYLYRDLSKPVIYNLKNELTFIFQFDGYRKQKEHIPGEITPLLQREQIKPKLLTNLHWEVGVAVLEYEVGPASLGSGKKAEKGILQEDEMELAIQTQTMDAKG